MFELRLQLSSCLYGYELRRGNVGNDLIVCQCVNRGFQVLNCEPEVIVLRDGLWAGREDEPLPHLDLSACPIPYCRCHTRDGTDCENLFFQNDPNRDLQCHPTRQGEYHGIMFPCLIPKNNFVLHIHSIIIISTCTPVLLLSSSGCIK